VVHQQTGTRLWVGNLGRREGGDIVWSVSHNAGRDADVAFAYLDATGKPIDPPDLVPLGRDGRSKDGTLALDVARTWIAVRAMLEYPQADIQYLFVSEPLKKKLLDYAKTKREPVAIVERAANVLRQPRGSAPHDDHLHLRIYCSEGDAACGCVDTGPEDGRSQARREARLEGAARARAQLDDPSPTARRSAVLRLGFVGGPEDVPRVKVRLVDDDASVRAAAAATLGSLGDTADARALVARFRDEREPNAAAAMVDAASVLGGQEVGELLRDLVSLDPIEARPEGPFGAYPRPPEDLIGPLRLLVPPTVDPREPFDRTALRRVAVRAAARADRLEPVLPLLALATPSNPDLARDALTSLSFITNSPVKGELDSSEAIAAAALSLTSVTKAMGAAPRDAWLVRGFAARGFRVRALDPRNAWELLRATTDAQAISYNARRGLSRLLRERADPAFWGKGDACRHFHGALMSRRAELGVGAPNEAQRRACWTSAKDADD
jgi:hypothetical protein